MEISASNITRIESMATSSSDHISSSKITPVKKSVVLTNKRASEELLAKVTFLKAFINIRHFLLDNDLFLDNSENEKFEALLIDASQEMTKMTPVVDYLLKHGRIPDLGQVETMISNVEFILHQAETDFGY